MNTRTVFAISALFVLLSGCSPQGVRSGVPEIARVSTFAELKAVDPVVLAEGWEIRLGLSDSGPDGGPWKLLYCLERYADVAETDESRGIRETEFPTTPIGPVRFSVDDPDSPPGERYASLAGQEHGFGRDALYCALIPTAWRGDYRIRVYANDGRILRQTILRVEESRPSYWIPFAAEQDMTEGSGDNDGESPAEVPDDEVTASYPRISGSNCIWLCARAPEGVDGEPLPGRLPGPGAKSLFDLPEENGKWGSCPLRLSVDGDVIRIDTPKPVLGSSHAGHLLARWWLNGQPVAATLAQLPWGRLYRGSAGSVAGYRLAFHVPEFVRASAGDRIGLHVLYSPGGFRPLTSERVASVEVIIHGLVRDPPLDPRELVPLLSNQIEFTATQDMLKPEQEGR